MRRAIIVTTLGFAFAAAGWLVESQAASDDERPAALVESIKGAPGAEVAFLDYVYPGQVLELGPGGEIVLSYFGTCVVETVHGSRLTVKRGASEVKDGKISTKKVPCQGAKIVVTAATAEAGASVTRVTPFQQQDWVEWTTRSRRPIFKWAAADSVTVRMIDLDSDPPRTVWHGKVDGNHLAYPADAPELSIGIPYEVRVTAEDGEPVSAVFSIGSDLEGPDTALARVVPIGR